MNEKVKCLNKDCPIKRQDEYYNEYCYAGNPYCLNRIYRKDGLTEHEGKIMDALVIAWNEFTQLEKTHPSETNDFMNAIHQCQNTLCMRILRRDYPDGYPTYNKQ